MPALKRLILLAAGIGLLAAADATAAEEGREVTLRMKGGGFQVTGEIRAFDGTRYIIESAQLGRLTLQAARFECIGSACNAPAVAAGWTYEALSPDRHEAFAIRGSDVAAFGLMPGLLKGYAASLQLSLVQVVGANPREARYRLVDARGKEVALVDIHHDDATASLSALERQVAAIALTDRAATKEEAEALAAAGPKIKATANEHVVGIDGAAVIVSPDHPASSLPIETIARIFSGQISDWYELGLPPGKIRLLLRDGAQAAIERFQAVILKPRGLAIAPGAERVASEVALADAVTRDRTAIGLVSFTTLRSAKPLNLETACGLIQRPTPFALKAGEYPLGHRIYLHAAAPPKQAAARGLLRYALSPEAQAIISEHQLVGQNVEAIALSEQSERMAHALNAQGEAFDLPQMRSLLADLKGSKRLSSTLRFVAGTPDLDAASKLELARLAALLLSPEHATKRVLLAGFSDANGAKFQANLTATYKRAGQARAALLAASGQKIDHRLIGAKGYGPLAPIACNDSVDGRRLNSRVEVWVRE